MELHGLLVHAALGQVQVALARAPQAGLEVDIDEQRHVWRQAAACDALQVGHHLFSQAAAEALVGQRRIREAVRQHDLPFRGGGQNHSSMFCAREAK